MEFLSLLFDIIINRVLVTVFPDCPGKEPSVQNSAPQICFLTWGHRLNISRWWDFWSFSPPWLHYRWAQIRPGSGHGPDQYWFPEIDRVVLIDIQTFLFEYLVNGFVKDHFLVLGWEYQVIDQYIDIILLCMSLLVSTYLLYYAANSGELYPKWLNYNICTKCSWLKSFFFNYPKNRAFTFFILKQYINFTKGFKQNLKPCQSTT